MEFLYKKIEEKWAPFFSCHVQKFYTIIECVCVCVCVWKKLKMFYKLLHFYEYMEFLNMKIEEKGAPFSVVMYKNSIQ